MTDMRNVEDLFAKARSEHMKSAQKFLDTDSKHNEDSSEDEEDDIGSLVLNGVFKSYANTYGKYEYCFCITDKIISEILKSTLNMLRTSFKVLKILLHLLPLKIYLFQKFKENFLKTVQFKKEENKKSQYRK